MKWLEHRVFPPAVALMCGMIMWAIARITYVVPISQTVRGVTATLLIVIAVSLILTAAFAFRRAGTTLNPALIERASSLVTSGIFQYTRNPMYLGLCILLTGVAVWLSAPLALVGPVIFVLYMSRFQIQPEERAMHTLFGDAYEAYCRGTNRWI